ncbi:MAG TPA: PIG-L family deacetylase [Candidatus Acidoferrum sp.]|nr:PIG-L family deacetylase [Candidatus Acidoferrum sp.]
MSRLRRLVQYFVQTSFGQTSSALLLLVIPILLIASPQTGKPPRVAAAADAAKQQTLVTRFPQLPYQGTPPELPQDQGALGLRQMLRRLGTTERLMQTVAHPDDEDGGMLTLESRGRGASVLLMTLNRGEGGQNKIGSNLSDVLGVLRAEELLASDEYYGVQERFSRVADFGFSKSADETFAKWGGHDVALGDMVRVIRTFRPDVLLARFSGTERDGHGHHQASSILTKEAFRAAADPKRFPEQIAQGLEPWQARKLYVGNVCGFGAMSCPDANWTIKLNTGERSADLGESYVQFAMRGLRHQLSQGSANWTVEPGDRFTFYKLVDSIEPAKLDKDGHEKDFFDGIDTTLPGLAARLGTEGSKVPQLRPELIIIESLVAIARKLDATEAPSATVSTLNGVLTHIEHAEKEVGESSLSAVAKSDLTMRLEEKQQQAETALNEALNVTLEATVVSRVGPNGEAVKGAPQKEADALTTVSPGQEFLVGVDFHNGSKDRLFVDGLKVEVPTGWGTISDKTKRVAIKPGENVHVVFRLQAPKDAAYTRPYWHRDDPETESINHIDDEKHVTLPFPPSVLRARVEYSITGAGGVQGKNGIGATVVTRFVDEAGVERARPLTVVPAFSVALEPGTQVITTHHGASSTVTVGVTSKMNRETRGILRLELPEGWQSEPAQFAVEVSRRGEKKDCQFRVLGAGLQEGRAKVRAVLEADDEKFSEGYTLVTREDLGSFYYYQPALQRVSIVDVKALHDLKIGYIMGAGDDIPTVLKQVGMYVTLIPPEKIAEEDLSKYGTIVLGIRAYDTQKDVATNNKKLLDFVAAGGTLVVQYNAGVGDFNSGHFTPFTAELSRARVSVEEAPVEILAPEDEIFHFPNEITARDFDGWVQERGLYFMDKWDEHFKPLLSCHDPGEAAQKGGLLRAQYGKGTYIYTGYAFFRQLPAGVPGAVRLYVNLLSAGHEKQ